MRSFQYLADGHHVDDAGNLISCTYVDFRDPDERFPIAALRKASSKRHSIPGCETIRISKPGRFLGPGEGLVGNGEHKREAAIGGEPDEPNDSSVAAADRSAVTANEAPRDRNGWIYCASIEPETPEEQAAWREAMPSRCDAVSPIRRPREFARALGAMAAEQVGPRGRILLLRNTVDERVRRRATSRRSAEAGRGRVGGRCARRWRGPAGCRRRGGCGCRRTPCMTPLRRALADYLAMRRALGYRLARACWSSAEMQRPKRTATHCGSCLAWKIHNGPRPR